jgi:diacylglycerol kinase (ATP)
MPTQQTLKPRLSTPLIDTAVEQVSGKALFVRRSPWQASNFKASFGYAWKGIRFLVHNESNFRKHLLIAALACSMASILGFTRWEWTALFLSSGLMLAVEALNSAIELLVDLIVGDAHTATAGVIKDVSAAACLLMAIALCAVGICLFLPHVWETIARYLTANK